MYQSAAWNFFYHKIPYGIWILSLLYLPYVSAFELEVASRNVNDNSIIIRINAQENPVDEQLPKEGEVDPSRINISFFLAENDVRASLGDPEGYSLLQLIEQAEELSSISFWNMSFAIVTTIGTGAFGWGLGTWQRARFLMDFRKFKADAYRQLRTNTAADVHLRGKYIPVKLTFKGKKRIIHTRVLKSMYELSLSYQNARLYWLSSLTILTILGYQGMQNLGYFTEGEQEYLLEEIINSTSTQIAQKKNQNERARPIILKTEDIEDLYKNLSHLLRAI